MPYTQLKAADPLARALEVAGLPIASWFVAFGAVVSLTAVLLVFQYGQPRIFFAMARDGLLPAWAAKIHPKYRTPHITTVVTGVVVAFGSLFMDENEIYDLTNIGTLSAFAIVCIGVLVLRYTDPDRPRPFRVPFVWPVALARRGGLPLHHEGAADACVGAVRRSGWRSGWRSISSTGIGTAGCGLANLYTRDLRHLRAPAGSNPSGVLCFPRSRWLSLPRSQRNQRPIRLSRSGTPPLR